MPRLRRKEVSMIATFAAIAILLLIGGAITWLFTKLRDISFGLLSTGVIALIILAIIALPMIIYVGCSESTIDTRIAILEASNKELEEKIAVIVEGADAPENVTVNAVFSAVEAQSLSAKYFDLIVDNNEQIEKLKIRQAKLAGWKWFLYFNIGG